MCDAKTDTAVPAGDDRDPAAEIEDAHLRFPRCRRTLGMRPAAAGYQRGSMDKPGGKIKYASSL
jgi:hypothetical protein